MSHKENDNFYENVREFFENPRTDRRPTADDMYDITREAWMDGYFACKDGKDISEAFGKFRGREENEL